MSGVLWVILAKNKIAACTPSVTRIQYDCIINISVFIIPFVVKWFKIAKALTYYFFNMRAETLWIVC